MRVTVAAEMPWACDMPIEDDEDDDEEEVGEAGEASLHTMVVARSSIVGSSVLARCLANKAGAPSASSSGLQHGSRDSSAKHPRARVRP